MVDFRHQTHQGVEERVQPPVEFLLPVNVERHDRRQVWRVFSDVHDHALYHGTLFRWFVEFLAFVEAFLHPVEHPVVEVFAAVGVGEDEPVFQLLIRECVDAGEPDCDAVGVHLEAFDFLVFDGGVRDFVLVLVGDASEECDDFF